MTDTIQKFIQLLFGLGDSSFDLDPLQMAVRAVWIYCFAIFIVYLGSKRFIGKNTAFDLLLGIMLGAVLSRAITGQAPLLGGMAAGVALLVMHWSLGAIAFRIKPLARIIKGRPRILIRDGQVDEKAMARSHLGEEDLAEALRIQGHSENPADIHLASLERSGQISVIPMKKEPQVIDVKVAAGVQTVRIELTS